LIKGEISTSTLKRKISSVIGFYRYLMNVQKVRFKFSLWEEGITSIAYLDSKGFMKKKEVITTDLSKTAPIQAQTYSDNKFIKDGGKLAPLTEDKQIILLKCLNNISNKEMMLGFLISLFTGARIGSVFTLRLKHFENEVIQGNEDDIPIKIGFGTDCDTKGDKRYLLYFPIWLYKSIKIYLSSPKATKRREKAKHIFDNENIQYVFLSNRGAPYYVSKSDPYKIQYRDIPNGNTIRLFIGKTLKKEFEKINEAIDFSFHDLRATFGMNTLNRLLPFVEKGEVDIIFVLHYIKERMGHSSLTTTEKYLNFKKVNKIKFKIQDDFETRLMEMISNEI
jgi:integrase